MLQEFFDALLAKVKPDTEAVKLQHDALDQPLLVIPKHQTVQDVSMYLKEPTRLIANNTFRSVDGFIKYVSDFKQDNTQIFCLPCFSEQLADFEFMEAIIDYHDTDGTPHWREHSARLRLIVTPQLKKWQRKANETMSPRAFINHLKDNAETIADPALAGLVDSIGKIKVNSSGKIEVNTDGHDSSISAKAEQKYTGVPEEIKLSLPLFYMGNKYAVKLRITVTSDEHSGIQISYSFTNLEAALETQYEDIAEAVKTGTGLTVAV